jgi:hypothetical protein
MRILPALAKRHLESRSARGPISLAFVLLAFAPCALAQHSGHEAAGDDGNEKTRSQDLLLFVSAKYVSLDELGTPVLEDDDGTPTADIFYTRSANRFRFLGEYLLTDYESDLERLQVGWQVSEKTRLWLGRFHQSASHWNTEHHHGQYLQTTISRPAIEEFEDLSGVLPSHTTGVLIESQHEIGAEAGLDLSFSAGLTTVLEPLGLEPFDLLDPDGGHGNGVSLRIGFLPDFLGDDQFGFVYGRHAINMEGDVLLPADWGPGVDKIDLDIAGLYLDWNWASWRVAAVMNRVETAPRGGAGGPRSDFVASYVQTEYLFETRWIGYARLEQTSGAETYLDIFPAYIRRQGLVGIKRLVGSRHAFNLELATSELKDDRFHGISVQWSAVVP